MHPDTGPPNTPSEPQISQAHERPTHDELKERIYDIAALLGQGASRKEIIRYVRTKTAWGVSIPTIDRYLAKAEKLMAGAARKKEDYILAVAAYRFNELYARSLLAGNFTEAREAVRDLCRLYGLPIDGQTGQGDPDDDYNKPIAILVGPERLPNTDEGRKEWERRVQQGQANRANPQPSIPVFEPTALITAKQPKAAGE